MKTTVNIHIRWVAFMLLLSLNTASFGQGRIVVNEFMSWSGCSTTSEFIELLNFGPGPMDIGCYIVTNGQYSVTIPPNTILESGQYYVISGQDVLSQGCGNVDSAVAVDLNWNTCNCADKPVPATGDGFFQDGGSSNEKVVLMDPSLNIVDAVSRKSSPSASLPITSSSTSGCTGATFDLDNMGISYESIDNSTGIDNSFARKVDGDCGWVKTTAISAGAPNKTGSTSSASYNFSTLSASECNGTDGSISIAVNAPDVASLFPMTYTLAFDKDSNNLFNISDSYLYGTDVSPSSIDIDSLAYGRYRITVGSSSGCNLQSFDFMIFNCYGIVLERRAICEYLGIKNGQLLFKFSGGNKEIKDLTLEAGDGTHFRAIDADYRFTGNNECIIKTPVSPYRFFRLRMVDKSGIVAFSEIARIEDMARAENYLWPNPLHDYAHIQIHAAYRGSASYAIFNAMGITVRKGELNVTAGKNIISIPTSSLPAGIYLIKIDGSPFKAPVSFRFSRQ